MHRRRPIRFTAPEQNLDSFLDILTNTVGVLMFIGLFVSLVAVETGTIVRTPLVAPSRKQAHFLEANGNEVFNLTASMNSVDVQVDGYAYELPDCPEPLPPRSKTYNAWDRYLDRVGDYQRCLEARSQQLKNFRTTTDDYRVRLSGTGAIEFELVANADGESSGDLARPGSEFRQLLASLNPRGDYLAFVVRPDSFEVFRKARQIAQAEGFEVGWEPFPSERSLAFGSSGRSIGVQ
ncbi:hypothetical protein KR51_00000500 [Rubidibacter lacunae KORDI 51-2]|uniref:Uncharacterized protein n=1 Tax=Rubidibacter lacunae KORDI 51-2 TaxID=582515 RepID=U5DF91_9CHRO|nr:hypothetical protein [Rubidibacter lacunae]ERN43158.1 hypothetical protein KR51_00000500 [Rubidibacter lacunae KORDI 51-2]